MEETLIGFDEFWKAYPRKVDKQAALRAYKKALKLVSPDKLISAAKQYAAQRSGQDAQYTKHPSSWLNAGAYDNYTAVISWTKAKEAVATQVYVPFNQRDAWDAYGRSIGKSYPRDKQGGWWFPSATPPSFQEAAE